MKFSCVIPTYNPNPIWLDRAVNSAVELFDETIVVDDGSTERVSILPKPFFLLKLIIHKTNKGQAEARNTGVREANGDIVAILDDDDYFDKEGVIALKEFIERNPDNDIYHFHLKMFGDSTGIYGENANPKELMEHNSIPGISWFKKDLWKELKGFKGREAEDWDFWIRAYKAGKKFIYFPKVVYYNNRRPNSLSANWTGGTFNRIKKEILERNKICG